MAAQKVDPSSLPKPGELLCLDFRSDETKAKVKARQSTQPISLLQWNIERGYKLEGIIEELKLLDADVLALQVSLRGCCDLFCLVLSSRQ